MTAIVTMNAADLRGLAVLARDALTRDDRTQLHGVHFRPSAEGAEAVASNGRGLALLSLAGTAIEGALPDAGITVPASTVALFPDTGGTVLLSLGEECSIRYRNRIEKTAPAPPQYPDYRAVLGKMGDPTPTAGLLFGAREMRLAASALEFFAINCPRRHDAAEFRFHHPDGPHEIRLDERDDLRLFFMPMRPPASAPSPTETPE